jgi:hypothetical protein
MAELLLARRLVPEQPCQLGALDVDERLPTADAGAADQGLGLVERGLDRSWPLRRPRRAGERRRRSSSG